MRRADFDVDDVNLLVFVGARFQRLARVKGSGMTNDCVFSG
jgi:hypothetical protein